MASKSRRNKTKFKWTKELIFLIVFLVAIITATIILTVTSNLGTVNKLNTAITDYNTENSTSYSTMEADKNVYRESSTSWNYDNVINKVADLAKSDEYTYFYYGSLKESSYLENMATINTVAQEFEVKTVYLFYSTYVNDAEKNSTTDTISYKKQVDKYEDILNKNVNKDVKKFDLTSYPALLVFKSGELVFNSQSGSDSTEYNWTIYINQALSISKRN